MKSFLKATHQKLRTDNTDDSQTPNTIGLQSALQPATPSLLMSCHALPLCFTLLDFFNPTPFLFGSYPFHSCPIFFLLPAVLASVWVPNTSEMVCFLILSISFCFTVISAGTSINHFLQGTVLKSSSTVHSSLVSIIQLKSASFDKKHFKPFLQVTLCDNSYCQICDLLFLSKHLVEVYAYRSNFSYHREKI